MLEAMIVAASWHAETFGGSNAVKDFLRRTKTTVQETHIYKQGLLADLRRKFGKKNARVFFK